VAVFEKSKRFNEDLVQSYNAGEVIVSEGDESRELYILQSGSAEVLKRHGKRDVRLTVLRKGDFFGEMSLLEEIPRSATVRTLETTKVMVIRPGGLLLKMRRDPTFAFEMLQQISARLRRIDSTLAAALAAGDLSPAAFEKITRERELREGPWAQSDED